MMTVKRNLMMALVVGLGFSLVACESEIDNKPAAKVVETKTDEKAAKADEKKDAKADKGAAKTEAASGWLAVDAATSKVLAVGAKVTGDHTVDFKKFDGKVEVKDGNVNAMEFTVQMADFTTDMGDSEFGKKLITHLQSPDFFDVEKHKTSTFKSTKITAGDSAAGTHTIEGNLTMRGVSKTVSFPATLKVDGKNATGKTEFTINRKDFGIEYPGKKDDLIKDNVLLKLDFKFAGK